MLQDLAGPQRTLTLTIAAIFKVTTRQECKEAGNKDKNGVGFRLRNAKELPANSVHGNNLIFPALLLPQSHYMYTHTQPNMVRLRQINI